MTCSIVVAKYGREVIDRVRVDQANQLRANPKSRQVIKRSRWLLLRNPENLPAGHDVKLTELLEANQPLNVVWLMKTALKELWYAPSEQEAQRRWASWYRQSQESGIKRNKGVATLCREAERVCRGHHRECQALVEYQRTGRDEQ
jgi:transposase